MGPRLKERKINNYFIGGMQAPIISCHKRLPKPLEVPAFNELQTQYPIPSSLKNRHNCFLLVSNRNGPTPIQPRMQGDLKYGKTTSCWSCLA